MATSLDKQLNRLERADAAAASVHCVQVGRDETTEAARIRYEAVHPIRDNDVLIFVKGHMEGETSGTAAKPRVVGVQRKRRVKPPVPAKTKPREWGGTTCPQPAPEHEDGKRDPYRSDWKKPLRYPDIYPSPDAGAADERALRVYAQKLSRRSSL